MNINWKWLGINAAIAGIFGITTGKLINLVAYYKGLSEGIIDGAQKGADELEAKYMEILAMKEKENEELKKENESLIEEINTYETKFSEIARKEIEEREKRENIEKAKEAIKNKKWDEVYRLTERWYNRNPVDMSRAEVFTNLEKDGYITKEQNMDAHDYFGNLWFYVGD